LAAQFHRVLSRPRSNQGSHPGNGNGGDWSQSLAANSADIARFRQWKSAVGKAYTLSTSAVDEFELKPGAQADRLVLSARRNDERLKRNRFVKPAERSNFAPWQQGTDMSGLVSLRGVSRNGNSRKGLVPGSIPATSSFWYWPLFPGPMMPFPQEQRRNRRKGRGGGTKIPSQRNSRTPKPAVEAGKHA